MFTPDADQLPLTHWDIKYEAQETGNAPLDLNAEQMRLTVSQVTPAPVAGNSPVAFSYTIDGLKTNTMYVFAVRAINNFATNPVGVWSVGSVDTVIKTLAAPKPDKVTDLILTPGNAQIHAEWDEGDGNGVDITHYVVEYSDDDGKEWETVSGSITDTMAMIPNLMNGTEYSVRVSANNGTAGATSEVVKATPTDGATPTPALPLFGVIGLGAGLLAAGRTRLRRRAQRQLTR